VKYREIPEPVPEIPEQILVLPDRVRDLVHSQVDRNNHGFFEELLFLQEALDEEAGIRDYQRVLSSLISLASSTEVVCTWSSRCSSRSLRRSCSLPFISRYRQSASLMELESGPYLNRALFCSSEILTLMVGVSYRS
jgi:hypothetical protein